MCIRDRRDSARTRTQAPPREDKKRKYLNNYCENLTRKAAEGRIDHIVGRDRETDRVIQILNRRQKNNPCLIGEPGVGKTAVAEGQMCIRDSRSAARLSPRTSIHMGGEPIVNDS